MIVFISQPMGGKTDDEINRARDAAIYDIKQIFGEKNDVKILDTDFDFPGASALYYLAKSIEYLELADVAYFMKDWEKYRGCRIEHMCCVEYGIPTLYET